MFRVFRFVAALAVLALIATLTITPLAQDEPPAPLPYNRTPDDIAAALSLQPPPDVAFNEYVPFSLGRNDNVPVSHFIIPRTIRVGITRGAYSGFPGCSAWVNAGMPVPQVIEMPFTEYVKNVLPNEWIHTWHPESLKAGAMAVKTFAWWKMTLRGTQWQRPNGADVVDNTCDQYYVANSRRASTDAAVEATWWYRMSRDNLIKNVHYLDTDTRCANTPALRPCMGQWGSQYKALDGWSWDQILQHYYGPTWIQLLDEMTAPVNTNLLQNASFASGMTHWNTWGGIAGVHVQDNTLSFFRNAGSAQPAVVFQNMPWIVYRGSPLRVRFSLGNTSSQPKTVSIHLHDGQWTTPISCQVVVPPNSPPLQYVLRATINRDWAGMRLEFGLESADGLPALQVRAVAVHHRPADASLPNECLEPTPGRPRVSAPVDDAIVASAFTLAITPGESNYRVGYAPAYEVEVSRDASFSPLVFTNAGNPHPSHNVPLTLPAGDYFVRVRQFDGIDRWSNWSPVASFRVRNFPATPVALTPAGDVTGFELADQGFSWTHDPGTLEYQIVIFNPDGVRVHRARFTAQEANCAATCRYHLPPGVALTHNRDQTWRVIAFNAEARAQMPLMTFKPALPGMPTLISPADGATLPGRETTFVWRSVPLAERYILRVFAPNGTRFANIRLTPAQANCNANTCSFSSAGFETPLRANRTYQWLVVAQAPSHVNAVSRTPRASFTTTPDTP